MKRNWFAPSVLAAGLALLAMTGSAAAHDHPGLTLSANIPPGPALNAGGPGAVWERLWTFGTGNPHTDLDFFTQGGETYVAVGTLAIGPNSGGQSIMKLTQGGQVVTSPPSFQLIANHPSAFCASDPAAATGLQHDVEATPKGNVIFNSTNPSADRRDAQLLLDSTDNEGRCHDSPTGGLNTTDPQGGLEIIDITNVSDPVEIGMTSHIGEAHTVNVDPKRPHIAFAVTSDFASLPARPDPASTLGCSADDLTCNRADEDADPTTNQGLALDGFEVVDLKSCMDFPPLTSLDAKRLTCANGIKVYRYRWPSALINMGHSVDVIAGCHELEIYPNDLLTCAGVQSTMLFGLNGAFNDNGTPSNYLDDYPNGTPLPCRVRDSSSPAVFLSGAKVVDCVDTDPTVAGNEMTIEGWKAIGSPSLTGVVHVGSVIHQGRPPNNEPPPYDSNADIQISHEAELTGSGNFILATDERGGGVAPPGSSCLTSPADNLKGNGGIHAYSINRLLSRTPVGVDPNPLVPPPTPTPQALAAWNSYALTPGGAKAIYRAAVRTQSEPNVCTAHVFHQIPGQNRIFMAWYSQATQVVDFIEHPNGTFEFRDAGWFIPENASTWTSAVFKYQNNGNGTFTYWGATGDFNLGTAGRNAVDVWKVTLPAPPAGPTAVSLIRFRATASRRGVLVRWQTAVENKTLGFNVFRTRGGRLEKVNRALIPARGGAQGAVYSLLDRKPARGRPTYRLQVVELGGKKVWHGSTTLER